MDSGYVLIVDDDPDARMILRKIILNLGLESVVARDGEEALQLVRERPPALILLDLMMPRMNGFEVLFHLRNNPLTRNIPVIVVSAYVGDSELPQLSGVDVMRKSAMRVAEMENTVTALLGGVRSLPADSGSAVTGLGSEDAPGRDESVRQAILDMLTEREIEVLQLLAAGHSNQEMALKLYVSINTIKTHLKSLYSKLNVTSRTQAIAHARSLRLIE